MSGCHACPSDAPKRIDWLFWSMFLTVVFAYLGYVAGIWDMHFAHSIYDLINTMWWGIVFGMVFIGILSQIPRDFIMTMLGTNSGFRGILRATFAGVLLDLCSHGILMVGAKLYERGVSTGQLMAFLIASPWNSLSLTLILWALIGFKWMMAFLLVSMAIGIISGVIFDRLVARGVLPENPNKHEVTDGFEFWPEARKQLSAVNWRPALLFSVMKQGVVESKMVLRWLFLGVVLASLIRAFMSPELFQMYFGATAMGLALTMLAATVIEVCSEGTTPIAADLLTRAGAPGNSFAFLMTGVSTDYTEIMVLKDTTKSWKVAFFLPLITVPQIVVISWIMNGIGV